MSTDQNKNEVAVGGSGLNVELCNDCGNTFSVPFDNGDGLVRCAACAVDFYMKKPASFKHTSPGLVKRDNPL